MVRDIAVAAPASAAVAVAAVDDDSLLPPDTCPSLHAVRPLYS